MSSAKEGRPLGGPQLGKGPGRKPAVPEDNIKPL
jgi:hypothetical protein